MVLDTGRNPLPGVASCPWCKSTTGVGSFKSYQLAKETYTRVCSSIAHRGHP